MWPVNLSSRGELLVLFCYRPRSEASEGYVFTGVCHSFCSTGGGGERWATPMVNHLSPPPQDQVRTSTPSPPRLHAGRRYASYWNAFLFGFFWKISFSLHETFRKLRQIYKGIMMNFPTLYSSATILRPCEAITPLKHFPK